MRVLMIIGLLTVGCGRSAPSVVLEKNDRQEAKAPGNPNGQPQAWLPFAKGDQNRKPEVEEKQPPQAAPGPNQRQGNPNPLGVVQGVRGAVNRTVTQNELNNLRIYIETASGATGEMPTAQQILTDVSGPTGDRKLAAAIQDGSIVLTGIQTREGIWAYEKNALTGGGLVVKSEGVETMTAQQLKQALGK